MAERYVAETRWKGGGGDRSESADVDLALAFRGGRSGDGEVAGGESGDSWRDSVGNVLVAGGDACHEGALDVCCGFVGGAGAQVAISKEGNGGDGEDGIFGIWVVEDGVGRIGGGFADDGDFKGAEEAFGGIETGGRIVVSGGDENAARSGAAQGDEEIEILFFGRLGRVGRIENVAGDDEEIGVFLSNGR